MEASAACIDRYDVYSLHGRLLHSCADQPEAERMMAAAFNAKYVVAIGSDGKRVVVAQRKELH